MKRVWRQSAVIVVGSGLLLSACKETKEPISSNPPPPRPHGNPPGPKPTATASKKPALKGLKVGDAAPALTLETHDGKKTDLSSLKGQWVLVYFYPKDDTPGCRIEAQGIRDAWKDFEAAKVRVFGVSLQDAKSHKAFISKEKLPFPLVVDKDKQVLRAFGVPNSGEYAARQTFLIGPDGKLAHIWRNVNPQNHAREILAVVKKSAKPAGSKAAGGEKSGKGSAPPVKTTGVISRNPPPRPPPPRNPPPRPRPSMNPPRPRR